MQDHDNKKKTKTKQKQKQKKNKISPSMYDIKKKKKNVSNFFLSPPQYKTHYVKYTHMIKHKRLMY
jgi:hypothetical protein